MYSEVCRLDPDKPRPQPLQNDLAITCQKTVPMLVGPTGGKLAMEATATFRVAEVRDNILSLGKLVRKSFNFSLGPRGRSMEEDGGSVPLYLERNSLRVEAHVLQRATRPGCVTAGTAVATTTWQLRTSRSRKPCRAASRYLM